MTGAAALQKWYALVVLQRAGTVNLWAKCARHCR